MAVPKYPPKYPGNWKYPELLNPVGVIASGGEATVLSDMIARPPDWIVLTNQSTKVFGAAKFGVDYALNLKRWITGNYREIGTFGDDSFQATLSAPSDPTIEARGTAPRPAPSWPR